eukprot:gb/GECG01010064.1/.p1 GENE.gb/GECG01010064.1/~~gb/GECG01010064.1/.p1  ORF type:complete len:157 (+),score=26.67 gb/GECG01010064.1/:1-471(+)
MIQKAANSKNQAQQAISKWRSEIGTKERAEAMMEQYKKEAETLSEALHIASEEFAQISGLEAEMASYDPQGAPTTTYSGADDTEDLLKEFGEVYSTKYRPAEHASKAHVESDESYDFVHQSEPSDNPPQDTKPEHATTKSAPRKFVVREDGTTSRE